MLRWLSAIAIWGLGRVLYSRWVPWTLWAITLAVLAKVILDVIQGGRICDW